MRICVLSDTHGHMCPAYQALRQSGPVDLLLHAGDLYVDALQLQATTGIQVVGVAGNCDFNGPAEQVLELENYTVLLTHGHRYRVKTGNITLLDHAESLGAQVVVFGHTHTPVNRMLRGIHLVNPGSAAFPRAGSPESFGLMDIGPGHCSVSIIELKRVTPAGSAGQGRGD